MEQIHSLEATFYHLIKISPATYKIKDNYRVHRTPTLHPTSTGKNSQYTWGDPKFPELLKELFKIFVQV